MQVSHAHTFAQKEPAEVRSPSSRTCLDQNQESNRLAEVKALFLLSAELDAGHAGVFLFYYHSGEVAER